LAARAIDVDVLRLRNILRGLVPIALIRSVELGAGGGLGLVSIAPIRSVELGAGGGISSSSTALLLSVAEIATFPAIVIWGRRPGAK